MIFHCFKIIVINKIIENYIKKVPKSLLSKADNKEKDIKKGYFSNNF